MKKLTLTLALISALALTACTSGTETAETSTTTEYTVPVFTTPEVYVSEVSTKYFDTYEELMDEYTKSRSGNYVHPLPDIVNTWETRSFSLCRSNYTLRYRDTANQTDIMLEIDFSSSYSMISDYVDQPVNSYGDSEIIEMTDRYAVKYYGDDDDYAILGITGDQNIMYTLVINPDDDENANVPDMLKEYKDILEL